MQVQYITLRLNHQLHRERFLNTKFHTLGQSYCWFLCCSPSICFCSFRVENGSSKICVPWIRNKNAQNPPYMKYFRSSSVLKISCPLLFHGAASSTVKVYNVYSGSCYRKVKRGALLDTVRQCSIENAHCQSLPCLSPLPYKAFLYMNPMKEISVQTKTFQDSSLLCLPRIWSLQTRPKMERPQFF